jgi:hypothetical protein
MILSWIHWREEMLLFLLGCSQGILWNSGFRHKVIAANVWEYTRGVFSWLIKDMAVSQNAISSCANNFFIEVVICLLTAFAGGMLADLDLLR